VMKWFRTNVVSFCFFVVIFLRGTGKEKAGVRGDWQIFDRYHIYFLK
jgi:hypothetical protein